MKVSDYTGGNYLKAADLQGREFRLTVAEVVEEQLRDNDTGTQETKAVMYFRGADKGLVLNATNMNRLVPHYGDDMSLWGGAQVVLYHDPSVEMRGRVVGGLRLRVEQASQPRDPAPPPQQPAPQQPPTESPPMPQRPFKQPDDDENEIPF